MSGNDLSYKDLVEQRLEAELKQCRKLKRAFLKELGVRELPKGLAGVIMQEAFLEAMRQGICTGRVSHDTALDILQIATATQKSRSHDTKHTTGGQES